jgi:zinc and cadmium transporter
MTTFLWILLGTFAVSAVSIIGIFALFLKDRILEKILLLLVGLSAGAMMGGAFLHLLPEAMEEFGEGAGIAPFVIALGGFLFFFLVEKVLHWRHCHKGHCDVHSFGYMNVIGDGVHNFIDGLILAATFMADEKLGLVALLAIILHEAPQEMSDFGVLLYAGFKKMKSLVLNYISATMVIAGGMVGYFFGGAESFVKYLLPFAAGGFIYIATADLLPEIKKEMRWKKFLPSFLMFLAGILLMLFLRD